MGFFSGNKCAGFFRLFISILLLEIVNSHMTEIVNSHMTEIVNSHMTEIANSHTHD